MWREMRWSTSVWYCSSTWCEIICKPLPLPPPAAPAALAWLDGLGWCVPQGQVGSAPTLVRSVSWLLVVGRARVTSRSLRGHTGHGTGRRSPVAAKGGACSCTCTSAVSKAPYRIAVSSFSFSSIPIRFLFFFSSFLLLFFSVFLSLYSLYSLICNRLILKHDPHLFFFLFSFPPNEMGYHGV